MAVSTHTTNPSKTLPRRTLIAGAAAALVAAPAAAALRPSGDPIFADKKRATVAAWAKLNNIYAEQKRLLAEVGDGPARPERLQEPMRVPLIVPGIERPWVIEGEYIAPAPKEGWPATTLNRAATYGLAACRDEFGNCLPGYNGPVAADTRKQAAELLEIRNAYEAARAAWWEKVTPIESLSDGPLNDAMKLSEDLIVYPVFTLAEVKDKLALVEEWKLFDLVADEAGVCRALLRDALAAAEREGHNA